jgi:rhamnose utilization protein RhaD (predicted bifunctional aldolase and dehydrogenase)
MIEGRDELERLINRSHLIGERSDLVVHGGGNTSAKLSEDGQPIMRIKASGTDLRTIGADGFPGLYLERLLPLREREAMSDEEMVAYLDTCMTEEGARKPSIETLLHAFLPAPQVDHVHADAICTLTNHPGGPAAVTAALGEDVALVPYIRPGFELSRRVAEVADARAAVLDLHGLVTWGDTPEQSYDLTIELVGRAQAYIDERRRPAIAEHPALSEREEAELMARLGERLEGELVLDRSQRRFSDRPDVEQVATAARATPDHVLRIGARSAVIRSADEADEVIERFAGDYRAYFERHRKRLPAGLGMLSPLPRVVLVPGLGAVTAGVNAARAKVNSDVAERSHLVIAQVLDTFGEVRWLSEDEIFDFDYWPLELRKLQAPK